MEDSPERSNSRRRDRVEWIEIHSGAGGMGYRSDSGRGRRRSTRGRSVEVRVVRLGERLTSPRPRPHRLHHRHRRDVSYSTGLSVCPQIVQRGHQKSPGLLAQVVPGPGVLRLRKRVCRSEVDEPCIGAAQPRLPCPSQLIVNQRDHAFALTASTGAMGDLVTRPLRLAKIRPPHGNLPDRHMRGRTLGRVSAPWRSCRTACMSDRAACTCHTPRTAGSSPS